MEIRPVGTELFYADGRMDGQAGRHDEAISRFSQFSKGAYKLYVLLTPCIYVVLGGYQNEELLFSYTLSIEWILGEFAKFLKPTITFVVSEYLPVRSLGKTLFPLDEFCNSSFMFEDF